jgi:protein gp37
MADVFEDFPGLDAQRARLWELIIDTPHLEWLILTKRPENMARMLPKTWTKNMRFGVTCENQVNADKRVPELLKAWKDKNFISYEPAIGPIDFSPFLEESPEDCSEFCPPDACIQWIICGGESGYGCRPIDLEWARDVRDQCVSAGVPFFFKQVGGFPDKHHDPENWPEDLRIREFPQ